MIRNGEIVRKVEAVRYITPLREGGSVPAVIEADDGGTYVLKFRSAGQGPKALIAELLGGEIGRQLGLNVPELLFVELDPLLARNEPHEEIRETITASAGLNLGMRFLPSAFAYNPLLKPAPDADLAALIVWFDSYILNVDRTARNVNLLVWEEALWLIDHGAAFYFQHDWETAQDKIRSPFAMVRQHVLLPFISDIAAIDSTARQKLDDRTLHSIVELLPEAWLGQEKQFADAAAQRNAYWEILRQRREQSSVFVEEASRARAQIA